MKYSIGINQLVLEKYDVDLADGALLDFIYDFCISPNEEIERNRIRDEDGSVWTWIDYSTVLRELPLLRAKEKSVISRRFKHLEKVLISEAVKDESGKVIKEAEHGFIKMKTVNQRVYIKMLPVMHTLAFKDDGAVAVKQRGQKKPTPSPKTNAVALEQRLSESNNSLPTDNGSVAFEQSGSSPKATEQDISDLNTIKQQALALLNSFKFSGKDRETLLTKYGPDRIVEVGEACKEKQDTIPNPIGWIKKALTENWAVGKKLEEALREKERLRRLKQQQEDEAREKQRLEEQTRRAAITKWCKDHEKEFADLCREELEKMRGSILEGDNLMAVTRARVRVGEMLQNNTAEPVEGNEWHVL